MMKKILAPLSAFCLFFAGCATSSITNLTPSQQPRNPENLYTFEAAFDTREQALRKETLSPYVIIGFDAYPMDRTPLLPNRWEALIPIPPDVHAVHYRFKFDYESLGFPQRQPGSKLSPPYRLEITGPPR